MTGALIGLGIPEYEAKRYEGRLQKGGILLSVHCDTSDQIKRSKEIIERTGGEDISSTGESSTGHSDADRAELHAATFNWEASILSRIFPLPKRISESWSAFLFSRTSL